MSLLKKMKKKKSKIKIREILEFVSDKEEIGGDLFPVFPVTEDYLNPCLIMCGGMTVHEIWIDARIGNKL